MTQHAIFGMIKDVADLKQQRQRVVFVRFSHNFEEYTHCLARWKDFINEHLIAGSIKFYFELGNSKLCEFCIYRVSFLTGTPLKVSVYNVNCAEKGLSARIYLPTYF